MPGGCQWGACICGKVALRAGWHQMLGGRTVAPGPCLWGACLAPRQSVHRGCYAAFPDGALAEQERACMPVKTVRAMNASGLRPVQPAASISSLAPNEGKGALAPAHQMPVWSFATPVSTHGCSCMCMPAMEAPNRFHDNRVPGLAPGSTIGPLPPLTSCMQPLLRPPWHAWLLPTLLPLPSFAAVPLSQHANARIST